MEFSSITNLHDGAKHVTREVTRALGRLSETLQNGDRNKRSWVGISKLFLRRDAGRETLPDPIQLTVAAVCPPSCAFTDTVAPGQDAWNRVSVSRRLLAEESYRGGNNLGASVAGLCWVLANRGCNGIARPRS